MKRPMFLHLGMLILLGVEKVLTSMCLRTIWYELLTRNFPFQGLNSQTIIFQVGFGMKSSLGKLNVNREAKVFLIQHIIRTTYYSNSL
jgi:hypothetical protein